MSPIFCYVILVQTYFIWNMFKTTNDFTLSIHSFVVPTFHNAIADFRNLQGNAPQYLVHCCKFTTDAASRQRLGSASRHQLIVPRHRLTKFGRRAFSVAGPTAWNWLLDYLRDPSLSEDILRHKDILVCVVLEHIAHLRCLRNVFYKFST